MPIAVDRRQALAFRVRAQGLDRAGADPAALAVLDLGVQETNVGSARAALAARLPPWDADPVTAAWSTTAWSFRGAPHLLRTADLPGLAEALWPLGEADARSRVAAERKPLAAAGIGVLEAFEVTARALRDVVTTPLPKGAVSAAVTQRLPPAYAYGCRGCGATHVYGGLFQLAAVFAGVALVPDASPATLVPVARRGPLPPRPAGPTGLLRSYVALHGPATPAAAASYLGTTTTALRSAWPDDLVEVRLECRSAWIPPERLDALRSAEVDGVVRLLPPADPYLQARDRELVVPDAAHRKAVWKILGNPGAVLVDGEVAGIWRAKRAGAARLDVTVSPFVTLSRGTRSAIEAEAQRLAPLRGATDVAVRHETP